MRVRPRRSASGGGRDEPPPPPTPPQRFGAGRIQAAQLRQLVRRVRLAVDRSTLASRSDQAPPQGVGAGSGEGFALSPSPSAPIPEDFHGLVHTLTWGHSLRRGVLPAHG